MLDQAAAQAGLHPALLEALVVAKVILLGKALGLGKKAGGRTLAISVLRSSLVYGCKVCLHEWQMDAGEELVEEVLSVPEPPPTAKSGSRLV